MRKVRTRNGIALPFINQTMSSIDIPINEFSDWELDRNLNNAFTSTSNKWKTYRSRDHSFTKKIGVDRWVNNQGVKVDTALSNTEDAVKVDDTLSDLRDPE